jgi:hypothetical protein
VDLSDRESQQPPGTAGKVVGIMARQVDIEFFSEGFEQILTSSGTMSAVQAATNGIYQRANANNKRGGTGFHSGTRIGRAYGSQRALGFVYTTDRKSAIAEAEDKALSEAVSAG